MKFALFLRKLINSKIYRNFIVSYIVILFIPLIVMSAIVLYNFVNVLKQEVEANLTNSFRKTVEYFDLHVQKLQEISLQIQLNEIFREVNIHQQPDKAITLKKELQKYSVNSLADKILVYSYEGDYILSADYVYSLKDFIEVYVETSENNFDLKGFKHSSDKDGVFYFSRANLTFGASKNIMYLNKLPLNGLEDPYLIVIYVISESSLRRILNPAIITDDSYLFVREPETGKVLFSFSESNNSERLMKISENLENYHINSQFTLEVGGKEFTAFAVTPSNIDLEFIQVVPADILENKINNIRVIYLLGVILIFAIGSFVIPLFARMNYSLVKKLKEYIYDMLPYRLENGEQMDEIEVLENALLYFKNESKELKKMSDKYSYVFRQYLLHSFILGQARQIENILESCRLSGLIWDKKYYAVMAFKVSKNMYVQKIRYIQEVLNPLYENKGLQIFVLEMSDFSSKSKIAIIIGSDENSEVLLKEYAIYVVEALKEEFQEDVSVGIGEYVTDVFDVHLSYSQALRVLDYNSTISNSSIMTISELNKTTEKEMKYPVKLFDKLEKAIRDANIWEIKESMDELMMFISTENLNVYWAKSICVDVITTIFKQLLLTEQDAIILKKPYIEKIYTSDVSSFEDIKKIMMEITDDLVDYFTVGEDAYELKLLRKIAQYIRQNYTKPDFSIQSLADHLHMTPPYLSQYFKKKTNYTISEYVTKLRMRKAKELLLNTDMSIADIAAEVGYYSVSSFIRRFREMEKVTPGEYKKKYASKEGKS